MIDDNVEKKPDAEKAKADAGKKTEQAKTDKKGERNRTRNKMAEAFK